MNGVWRHISPECINDFSSFTPTLPQVQQEIIRLARDVGFEEVNKEDVEEVLVSHEEDLTNEELMQLKQQCAALGGKEVEEETMRETRHPTEKKLSVFFRKIHEALDMISEENSDQERSMKASRGEPQHLMLPKLL